MAIRYQNFDALYNKEYLDIYRLCFLLVRHGKAAEEMAFQTFLKMGTEKVEYDEKGERLTLYSHCLRTCEDFYYRKLRRRPGKKALEEMQLCFPVTDALVELLHQTFLKRACLFLHGFYEFSLDDTARIAKCPIFRAGHMVKDYNAETAQLINSILPDGEFHEQLNDRIYMRFSERSVSVENALAGIRSWFDRAVPFLALIVVLFMIFAVYYVNHLF